MCVKITIPSMVTCKHQLLMPSLHRQVIYSGVPQLDCQTTYFMIQNDASFFTFFFFFINILPQVSLNRLTYIIHHVSCFSSYLFSSFFPPAGAKPQIIPATLRPHLPPQLPAARPGAPRLPPGQHAAPWRRMHPLLQVRAGGGAERERERERDVIEDPPSPLLSWTSLCS